MKYNLEQHVNFWVKDTLKNLGLEDSEIGFESNMSDYLKTALKGSAKTENKSNFGKPDFIIEKYKANNLAQHSIPVLIEDKLHNNKLIAENKDGIKSDDNSIRDFAVNGAINYATTAIASKKYDEIVAVGITGESAEEIKIKVYYVYGATFDSVKEMTAYTSLNFLENETTFAEFYKEATLTEEEKHRILIDSREKLGKYSKELNKLMHDHAITAPQRVLYVSGMLLSMQDIDVRKIKGLTPNDLKGAGGTERDGLKIKDKIGNFLDAKKIPQDKKELMLSSFAEISKDAQRDEPQMLNKAVARNLGGNASINKQIFTYIYDNIFTSIDAMAGHLDIMGEMYSEFLKYALGDGKEIGIVLTPPYVTKMMAEILNVNKDDRVMDLATGSASFLISSMEMMINEAETEFSKGSTAAADKIQKIKKEQLLGVELNAEMYTLATTNMILRGDGSARIEKGSSFDRPAELYSDFKATKLLLNPPFSYDENGMPFIAFGLKQMSKGGRAAIIIQDSAGSGKAIKSTAQMLKNNTLLASIKMPTDLFQPMAGVQTSVYVLEAGTPHDTQKTVKFIDFRNDGYKRTSRSLNEIDQPQKRYADIVKIFKAGKQAKVEAAWNLNEVFVEDFITLKGNDWNFDQHKRIDTRPVLNDFKKTVADYLAWEVSNILKGQSTEEERLGK
ncbi:MAG: SAM-dependent methyltransferase [Ignavibacteria bacterium]|jgi:type I restriction-modification system DNA methylase subunit|nr:SAM-dependent methyltransferase [Ignavibacteria bacterium]